MGQIRASQCWRALGSLLLLLGLSGHSHPVAAEPWAASRHQFATSRFEQLWRAADEPVAQGRTERSWTWGPRPWFDYHEFYRQSPDGLRLVQYFDKSRMEITDAASTGGPLGEVSNGLLVVELVSGRLKLGDGIGPEDNAPRPPSELPVAGDPVASPSTPTYASFRSLATLDNGYRDLNRLGERADRTLSRAEDGSILVGTDPTLAGQPGVELIVYEPATGHNIPQVFETYRQGGPVPALVAFGYPISDPYWVRATVGGTARDVLVQLFERRVLTYTPSNAARYRVEMGNVGQHYFQWRYPQLGASRWPWMSGEAPAPLLYASVQRAGGQSRVATIEPSGLPGPTVATDSAPFVPFTLQRHWDASALRLYGDSARAEGRRQLASIAVTGGTIRALHFSSANDYQPAVSPDGTKLIFVSDRDGNPELYLLSLATADDPLIAPARLTETTGCVNQNPSWLPAGRGVVFESNCRGNFDIYLGRLSYRSDLPGDLRLNALITPDGNNRLTSDPAEDRFPRLSPDGRLIAFVSTRDANAELYIMSSDGREPFRLTVTEAIESGPSWAADGRLLAYRSVRDGEQSLWLIEPNGANPRSLLRETGVLFPPVWAH